MEYLSNNEEVSFDAIQNDIYYLLDKGSYVEMKKPHACTIKSTGKKANRWEITRVGADIKIRCTNCDHVVMMSRL